jgi:hypothetical protein
VSFLNPLFLFGLLAAALPIIIHLFTRRRPREIPFSSLEFLTEVNQSEIRRLRIKQWLLLLLRTLAVTAIALAMARPALRGALGPQSAASTTVVVLVDRSASMGAAAPTGTESGEGATLLGEARRVVEGVLATLGAQDELLLVPYDQSPEPTTQRPSADIGRLRTAAQNLSVSARTTDHRRALEFAADALARSHALNRELFWITDLQSVGWTSTGPFAAATARIPEGPWAQSRVYVVPLVPRSRANVCLADASLTPSEAEVALSVTSRSFGAPPGDLAVEAREIGAPEALGRGFLNVPERGEASALLPLAHVPEQGGVVTIPDDALSVDNRRLFASGRSGTLRILMREDGPPSPLRLALEAGAPASGLTLEAVDPTTIMSRLPQADALVINDVTRLGTAEVQAVLDFHRSGGGIFIVFGARADAGFWNGSVLHDLGAGELGGLEQAGAGGAWRLQRAAAGHPALTGFPARPGEAISVAQFHAVRAFRPAAGTRIVLDFDRAHPALIEAPRAMVFAAGLDAGASDFPTSGAFLPLAHQVTRVLARGTAAGSLVPGDQYRAPATTGAWRIEDDQGREVASELVSDRGASRLESAPLERPGLYRVLLAGQLRNTFAVNLDVRESDLTPVPERDMIAAFPAGRAQILRPGADLARRVREARYGRELWTWFVVLALLLLVIETIVARVGMTTQTPAPSRAA